MTAATDTRRWVTAAALEMLAARPASEGFEFTSVQLALWTQDVLTPEQRVHASSRLCHLGFVRHGVEIRDGLRVDVYRVTAEGAAAIQAAAQGTVRKSGPKGTRAPNPVQAEAFATRLWALLRLRKMLTASEGAQTLCNVEDDDYERKLGTARKCLRRWADSGALAESARRVGPSGHSNGEKRFVLVKDSPEPPRWRQAAKARTAAAGGSQ